MKTRHIILTALIFAFPNLLLAENKGATNPVHKYWTCAISSYHSLVDRKYQETQCSANTEYSEPPCREFVVEYEGTEGIRPGVPFEQTIPSFPDQKSTMAAQPATTRIEINKKKDQYFYTQTVEHTGISATNKWVYNGKCNYNEAPAKEKIYMDFGLKTAR
jgi:hypothetical protein